MQPNITCPSCSSESWLNQSRSLSQIERDSGCVGLWECESCGYELVTHSSADEQPRDEYSPLDHLS